MRKAFSLFLSLVLSTSIGFANNDKFNHDIDPNVPWAYDAGPDITTKMGKELVDLVAAYPHMPEVSEQIMNSQKFRPVFGPTFWRTRHQPNSAKILFIGQDATHIAEASGRTATAGFGGRAQDMAAHFGIDESASFMNTYQNTIRGQYGAYDTPYLYQDKDGELAVDMNGFLDAGLWLMSQDQRSPLVKWRNKYIDWFLRNNRDMKLIVLFGGSARDSIATFIESKGGKVGTRISESFAKKIQVPLTKEMYAGGNNVYPAILDKNGKDLAAELLGRRVDYKNTADQKAVQEVLKANPKLVAEKAAFTEGGPLGNGMIHPAQFGGYDLDKIQVNGKNTISLKGLKLSDGSTVGDVLVVDFPHPTYLSRSMMDFEKDAEKQGLKGRDAYEFAVKKVAGLMRPALETLRKYENKGWKIEADKGKTNHFAEGKDYRYGRTPIGPEYYDFGTTGTRMLDKSLASRQGADVIVFGTRERAKYDKAEIDAAKIAEPGTAVDAGNIFTTQARTPKTRYLFDRGPGEMFARIMKENLNLDAIFKTKDGKSWNKDGIDAYNVKNHPELADFGHYRGTFDNPEVIILADPHGWDDLNTSRALTGSRGQYLQSILNSMGVNENYLVIKTVPFGMQDATDAEWSVVLEQTSTYREKLLKAVLQNSKPKLILADGKYAASEIKRILPNVSKIAPFLDIERTSSDAMSGLDDEALLEQIAHINGYEGVEFNGQWANIPKSHLPYGKRVWEGTSGDRVFNAVDKYKGLAFALVAPQWAHKQNVQLSAITEKAVDDMKSILEAAGMPYPDEKVSAFFERKAKGKAVNKMLAEDCESILKKAN